MADKVVTTAFKAQDQVTGAFKNMAKGADKFGTKSAKSFNKASGAANRFKGVVKDILKAQVITRGLGLIRQGVQSVTEEFISFDDAITAAAAKFGGIERGTQQFEDLKKSARGVGATTEYTATAAAEGLRFLAKAGYDASFSMKALPSFVDLATASENDFARATDIASDVMGAFRLNTDDTAEKLKNLIRVNDVMSKAVNMSNIDMEDLFETMKESGPIAVDAGVSLEKFTAIAAFIGGAGIKGSKGGTALKNAILALTAPTPKAIKELKRLGIQVLDAEKNLRDPIKIFDEFRQKTKDMGNAQKSAALNLIFGKRAIAGVSVSMAGGEKALDKFEQALLDAGGESKKLANLMRQSVGKRLEGLKSALIETAFKFIDSFEKKIPGAIDAAINAVRNFDVKPIIEDIKTAIKIISGLYTWVKRMTPVIKAVAAAWIFYKVQMKAALAVDAASNFLKVAKAAQVASGAKGIGGLARVSLNKLGKGGAVTLAVGAVALAVTTIHKNWDGLKASWSTDFEEVGGIWNVFKGTVINMGHEFKKLIGLAEDLNKELVKIDERDEPKPVNVKYKVDPKLERIIGTPGKKRKIEPIILEFGKMDKGVSNVIDYGIPLQGEKTLKDIDKKGGIKLYADNETKRIINENNQLRKELRTAPNEPKEQARQNNVGFKGELNINGAPPGSTVTSKTTGAPPIKTQLAGVNP